MFLYRVSVVLKDDAGVWILCGCEGWVSKGWGIVQGKCLLGCPLRRGKLCQWCPENQLCCHQPLSQKITLTFIVKGSWCYTQTHTRTLLLCLNTPTRTILTQKRRHIPTHRAKGTPSNVNTHMHTQCEQQAELLCQVAEGISRLRTSGEEEERFWPALKARGKNCSGSAQVLDAAVGSLEGFPGHVCWWGWRVHGMVSGLWSAPSVTEKCDPRHSCPVLSWTPLSVGPEMLRLGLHSVYCSLHLCRMLNKTYLFPKAVCAAQWV